MRLRAIFRQINILKAPISSTQRSETKVRDFHLSTDSVPFTTTEHNLSRWGLLLRPFTLGLLCLSLSVVLWGLGYKLSLYHPHRSATTRTGVAKLWVGPREALSIVCVCAESTGHSGLDDLHSPFALSTSFFPFKDAPLNSSGKSAPDTRFRLLLGTLRSPPHVISE